MSDIEDFTSDVLLRAKARSKYIKRTLGQEVEDTVLADPDEPEIFEGATTNSAGGGGGEDNKPSADEEEVGENNNEEDVANDSADFSSSSLASSLSSSFSPLPLISPQRTSPRKLRPHQQLIAVAPLTPHHLTNVQVTSASPGGRVTRLKALAQTINAWDDDYSHHCPPTSRFNLSKASARKSSIAFHPYASSASSSSSSSSHSSTFTSTTVNTTTATVASDYSMDSGRSGTEKVVLDDSVLNALEAQGYVPASPTKTKLLFDYKNPACTVIPGVKENSPRKYVLPSPQKTDKSPVKRAASPVRPVPFCSRTPSPTKSPVKPTVVDSVPKVVGSCSKQVAAFESSAAKEGKELPKSTAAKFEAQRGRVSVAEKAAMFESKSQIATKEIDPTELSVAERARLFEGGNSMFKKPTITSTSNNNTSINNVRGIMRSSSPTRNNNIANDNVVSAVKPFISKMVMRPSMVPEKPLRSKLLIFEKGIREELSSEDSEPATTTTNTKSSILKGLPQKGAFNSGVPPPPPLPATSSPVVSSAPLSFRDKSGVQDDMSDVGFEESSDDNNDDETLNHSTPLQRRKGSVSPTRKREVSFAIPASKSPSRTPSPTRQYANPSPAKRSMPSPKSKYPGARDVKRIRVSDPKPGRIYPSLTDIETTETETDTDVDNRPVPCPPEYQDDEQYQDEDMDSSGNSMVSGSSLGTYIERKAVENSPERNSSKKQQQHHRRYRPSVVSSSAPYEEFNASLACRQVDAFIDEALEGQDISMETVIDESSPVAASSPLKSKRRSPSPSRSPNRLMGMNNQPLMHTVSFYRLQQSKQSTPQTITATPKRVLESIADVAETSNLERTFSHEDKVNATIAKLGEEVQAQQRAIAQSSKALSLCKSTMEFSDSQENVECERILLIATQKHAALVNEIHRLKTEGILGKKDLQVLSPSKNDLGPSCQGNMKIQELAVQLKREFVNMAMKGQKVYHFIAIAKYRHQTEASPLVSMGNGINTTTCHGGVLYFPNAFTIGNLEPDFRVQVEIFMLETMREYLPHEAKYHIKKDSKSKMTPKKMKDSHSKTLFRHFQHSPAGPDVVQPCRFKPVGSLNIDISTLQRSHWMLEKVLSTSPLDGNVSIKISCSAEGGVEERGFLTMFQDVSGFGAWHRRWCKLTSSELSFWMYPEDENNAAPLGSIALRYCVTTRVGPVPRDVCARANTFLLVTTRSPQEGDKDSLVTSCRENYTAIRHLISADTKEERELWCRQLNRSLANLRAWDPQAHSPDDSLF